MSVPVQAPDRAAPPAPGTLRPFSFPDVQASRAESGMAVRVVRMPRLPVVTASLVLPAGETQAPPERPGLAVLTGEALQAGTAHRSGADLAEALEGIGAGVSANTGWDATTVALACLSERLPEALTLLAELVGEPAFPEDEFERHKSQRIATIEQRLMDPRSLADDAAAHFFYREGATYARRLAGSPDAVAGASREDATSFARGHYPSAGAGLVVAGDVDPDALGTLAERHFHWGDAAPRRDDAQVAARVSQRTVFLVHRPGAVQSEIRIGHVGVARRSPDYFPLRVFNTILGGAFTSRLNLNLREEHGFTYGVRSRFAFRRGPGPFMISTAVANDVTAPAVREAMSELEGLLEEGPTEAEVEAAQDYIVGVFPLRLETTSRVASRIAELLIYDLPDDYYRTFRDQIRAVSRDQALDAGRRAIRPGELGVVVVGDAEQVKDSVAELDLGPLEVHEADGLFTA